MTGDLFDDGYKGARRGDPATSYMAAHTVNVSKRQQQVVDIMLVHPLKGWIASEIDRAADYHGLWKRLSELERKGLVETRPNVDGDPQTRINLESGNQMQVYWLTSAAIDR